MFRWSVSVDGECYGESNELELECELWEHKWVRVECDVHGASGDESDYVYSICDCEQQLWDVVAGQLSVYDQP